MDDREQRDRARSQCPGGVEWGLVLEAFLFWKQLYDAERGAHKAGDLERHERLGALTSKAWRRYKRRWVHMKGLDDFV
jgi:hypothetical protein